MLEPPASLGCWQWITKWPLHVLCVSIQGIFNQMCSLLKNWSSPHAAPWDVVMLFFWWMQLWQLLEADLSFWISACPICLHHEILYTQNSHAGHFMFITLQCNGSLHSVSVIWWKCFQCMYNEWAWVHSTLVCMHCHTPMYWLLPFILYGVCIHRYVCAVCAMQPAPSMHFWLSLLKAKF